jgi:hypothetical protein
MGRGKARYADVLELDEQLQFARHVLLGRTPLQRVHVLMGLPIADLHQRHRHATLITRHNTQHTIHARAHKTTKGATQSLNSAQIVMARLWLGGGG